MKNYELHDNGIWLPKDKYELINGIWQIKQEGSIYDGLPYFNIFGFTSGGYHFGYDMAKTNIVDELIEKNSIKIETPEQYVDRYFRYKGLKVKETAHDKQP